MAQALSERQRRVLFAAVTEYIATGEPVASRRLKKRYEIEVSPATIRNALADLEDAGYLRQPHTSAGRVPTELGFRVFVDALAHIKKISAEHRRAVRSRLQRLGPRDDLVEQAGELLTTLTGAASVVLRPRPEDEPLDQLRFMQLGEQRFLAVLVTRAGTVQNRVVQMAGAAADPLQLERLNNYLAEHAPGHTLVALRDHLAAEQAEGRGDYAALRAYAVAMVDATTDDARHDGAPMIIAGQRQLFDRPEFRDPEKIRGYLRAFEDQAQLVSLLDHTLDAGGVQVLIGRETRLDPIEDISVIASRYDAGEQAHGTLGVVGPTRIDYAKVVPLVGYTAAVVSEVLAGDDPEATGER